MKIEAYLQNPKKRTDEDAPMTKEDGMRGTSPRDDGTDEAALSTIRAYAATIDKYRILTHEETVALSRKAKAGDKQAKDTLICSNLRLVLKAAYYYANKLAIPAEDAIQNGSLGLMRAVELWDPDMGYRFSTYAVQWIKQGILKGFVETERVMRIPAYMSEMIARTGKFIREFKSEHKREPDIGEIAGGLGMKVSQIEKIMHYSRISREGAVSLDAPICNGDEDFRLQDTLADETPGPEKIAEDEALTEEIMHALDRKLDDREKIVIRKRFGLEKGEPETLKEVAEVLDLSRERVRQIELQALKRLKRDRELRWWAEN